MYKHVFSNVSGVLSMSGLSIFLSAAAQTQETLEKTCLYILNNIINIDLKDNNK
jgi:hypothetical protein